MAVIYFLLVFYHCNSCVTWLFEKRKTLFLWLHDFFVSGQEVELTMHDGTVRDLCFLEDTSNKSSLLISGGAGDCKIYVTDCATGTPFQALSGHSGHVLTLYNWGGAMFVSGSQDKTVRFWDLRTRGCVNMVTPATVPGSRVSSVPRRRNVFLILESKIPRIRRAHQFEKLFISDWQKIFEDVYLSIALRFSTSDPSTSVSLGSRFLSCHRPRLEEFFPIQCVYTIFYIYIYSIK